LREIAAETYREMIRAGGDYPGFVPLIRSTPTLGEEHETWTDYTLKAGDPLFVNVGGCKRHYHAPATWILYIGYAPRGTEEMEKLCLQSAEAVKESLRPGVTSGEVYQAWQNVIDRAGLSHYRRHHCGYALGIGFPPSWVGGSRVVGLAPGNKLVLKPGMVFHHGEILDILHDAGAGVDRDKQIARFPSYLVEECIGRMTSRFTFYARRPEHCLDMNGMDTYFSGPNTAVNIIDLNGNLRPATTGDGEKFSRL